MKYAIKSYEDPDRTLWPLLVKRPAVNESLMEEAIEEIFNEVRERGDDALRDFTRRFDAVDITDFKVNQDEWARGVASISQELKDAIEMAYHNIYAFHATQVEEIRKIETLRGVTCWRESRPINPIGIYIPGGTAPLFSTVLMLAIPAKIAGCHDMVLCTPPDKNGKVHPAVLYAAQLCEIDDVCKVGGAQAIAALTLGTSSIRKVNKIFGPGNQYVTAAKIKAQLLGCPIDLPAGPSEVLVYADESCPLSYIVSDLLAQAEHGPDSQVVLVTDGSIQKMELDEEINRQLEVLPRKDIARAAMDNAYMTSFQEISRAFEFINDYAPEHLIIACQGAEKLTNHVMNAGSVFVGNYSPESAGDYASGTNHTLPTSGYAKNYSGVSVDSFVKKITFQALSKEGLNSLGPSVIKMAEEENLHGHANAIKVRMT